MQKFRNNNKISLYSYIKNSNNIKLSSNIKIHSNASLDASNGNITLYDNITINRFAFLNASKGNIIIGNGSEINNYTIINGTGDVVIGKNVLIGPSVQIISYSHNFKNKSKTIKSQGIKRKKILIEDDVWIGAGAIIMPGVKIAKGSVIGANSIVTKDTTAYSVNVGSPSHIISNRE